MLGFLYQVTYPERLTMNLTLSVNMTYRTPAEQEQMKQSIEHALKLNQEEFIRSYEKSEQLMNDESEWFLRGVKADIASRTVSAREGEDTFNMMERIVTLLNLHSRAFQARDKARQERIDTERYIEELNTHRSSLNNLYSDLHTGITAYEVFTAMSQKPAETLRGVQEMGASLGQRIRRRVFPKK